MTVGTSEPGRVNLTNRKKLKCRTSFSSSIVKVSSFYKLDILEIKEKIVEAQTRFTIILAQIIKHKSSPINKSKIEEIY